MTGRRTAGMLAAVAATGLAAGTASAAGEFLWPTTGWLSSTHVYSNGVYHTGSADIATGFWSQIGAGRAGNAYAYWEGGGCGNYSYITHGNGYNTNYCHQVRWPVVGGGAWVGANQLIGYVGSTGNSTGPHLHYTIFRWGVRQVIPGIWIGKSVARGSWVPGTWSGLSGSTTTTTTTSGGGGVVRIDWNPLNVRSGPGTGYTALGTVSAGQYYVASFSSGGWWKIWYDNRTGWVYGSGVTKVGGVSAVVVNNDALNVRSAPWGAVIATATRGEEFFWISSPTYNSGFYKIYFRGGTAYVHGDYVYRKSY